MSAPYCDLPSSIVVLNVAKCLRMFMAVMYSACRWKCGWFKLMAGVVTVTRGHIFEHSFTVVSTVESACPNSLSIY